MSEREVDVPAVLASLKDFQRASVEFVFRRLYLEGKRRFLVADEVGLGKTLVARGVIAKAIEHLKKEGVPRIDIVYICSNADIARQNVNRLNVTQKKDFALASRITLLPTQIRDLKKNDLNFISFTPTTSFDLRSNLGTWQERVLIFRLLRQAWDLQGKGPLRLLEGTADRERFEKEAKQFDQAQIDEGLNDDFRQDLLERLLKDRKAGRPDMRLRFDELAERLARSRGEFSDEDRAERARLVGELRTLLATTCLKALEPDLIILDEFQRFKGLLEGQDDASLLARDLFEYDQARVLLLSATPYRMYTLDHEAGQDDHYEDFARTVGFLQNDARQTQVFREMLSAYGREARTSVHGNLDRLREAKLQLEMMLRQVMIRTERLGASEDRNGMLVDVAPGPCRLETADVQAYVALQKIASVLEQPDTLEYWKSAPYLLSFMDDYVFKQEVTEGLEKAGTVGVIAAAVAESGLLSLKWDDVASYAKIDPGNSRLRTLMDDTVGRGLSRLLWLPPSFPYYKVAGVHADVGPTAPTKRLVFSSWKVVPKVIAALVSYGAERELMLGQDEKAQNTPEARKRRRGLLRFARESDGTRLAGMPVLGMIYPSLVLAERLDPLRLARQCGADGEPPTLEAVAAVAEEEAAKLIGEVTGKPGLFASSPDLVVDENWYWAAPILIDSLENRPRLVEWLARRETPDGWSDRDEKTGYSGDESLWAQHVARARELALGRFPLGAPPTDLARVVALLGLAGPGVAAARALSRVAKADSGSEDTALRDAAGAIAWGLRNLFNLPESMAIVRTIPSGTPGLRRDGKEPYWLSVLLYCAEGGLQATLDEYAHVLKDSLGLIDKPVVQTVSEISSEIRSALGLRTAALGVDFLASDGRQVRSQDQRMRARFALRFGQEEAEETGTGTGNGATITRAGQVRTAFNSPFWPFVLATTSVGQEGLDFHPYCHAIVHWNLPANPVDLEQREGRIHRYKGHAVRKNVAAEHGHSVRDGTNGHDDPWAALFELASRGRTIDSDIVPFWVFPRVGGASIERHVPALPLSRDTERLASLRKSLAVYRMVFGQARQEELLVYLLGRVPVEDRRRLAEDLRIDLTPPVYTVGEGIGGDSNLPSGSRRT